MTGLGERIQGLQDQLVEIRHDLHQHPELGYQETRTSSVVARQLTEWGIEHRTGLALGTGILAYLPATRPGGCTIALRADMDALPIFEETGKDYASQTPGVMHACGHDGHTTILLGVARTLAQEVDRPNDVLFMFQPAEEGGAGGEKMCQDGVLDGRVLGKPVDLVYGLHGLPMGRLGTVETRVGAIMAAAEEIRISIRGKGAHAAYPHLGVDPVVIAAHLITALQTVASRTVSPLQSVVVTIGQVEAGKAHNVIPEIALLRGTLRTLDPEVRKTAKARIEEIVAHVPKAFGAEATIEWSGGYPVVINDRAATERFVAIAESIVGPENVVSDAEPSMGGEDFAFYGQVKPACFFFLGLAPDGRPFPNLHTPQFDFNDAAIPLGVRLMTEAALRSR